MALSLRDQSNASATSFNVKLKYFINTKTFGASSASIAASPITASDFNGLNYGTLESNGRFARNTACGLDTIITASYISELIMPFDGTFSENLEDESIKFESTVNGIQNQTYLPRINDQIFCLRKIINKDTLYENAIMYMDFEGNRYGTSSSYTSYIWDQGSTTRGGSIAGLTEIYENGKYGDGFRVAPSASNRILNPSFETNSASFNAAYRCSGASTKFGYSGSYSMKITSTSTGANFYATLANPALTANTQYAVSAYLWQSSTDENKIKLTVLDRYTPSSSVLYQTSPSSGSGWKRHEIILTTNAAHTNLEIRATGASTSASGESYFADAIQVESGSEVTPYLDGSLGTGYSWSGTEHASSSSRLYNYLSYGTTASFMDYGSLSFWLNLKYNSGSRYIWGGSPLGSYLSGSKIYLIGEGLSTSVINASTGIHHYAYTWNASTGQYIKLYIDGSYSGSRGLTKSSSAAFVFGAKEGLLSASNINSIYDDIIVFNKVLSANEISTIYNRGHAEILGNDWHLWWAGMVTNYNESRDYTGIKRNITIGGINTLFEENNSPRIEIGNPNKAEGATVATSSELALPELEVDNGEFFGTVADVQGKNTVDNDIKTVWISQDPPSGSVEPNYMEGWKIDEVFFKPIVGWNADDVWWIELYNGSDITRYLTTSDFFVTVYNDLGESVQLNFLDKLSNQDERFTSTQYGVQAQGRCIICGDLKKFEAYTGGARWAEFIAEANTWGTSYDKLNQYNHPSTGSAKFVLRPEGGYVAIGSHWDNTIYDFVCWGTNINGDSWLDKKPSYISTEDASPISVSALTAGQSIRRIASGHDTDSPADWKLEDYPKPGNKLASNQFEWVKVELPALATNAASAMSAGNTTIYCDTTNGWPNSGSGKVDTETFIYTSKTNTTFTLSGSISNSHADGSNLYPLNEDNEQMTGWLIEDVTIKRLPGLSKIQAYAVVTSKDAGCGDPDSDPLWQNDYYDSGRIIYIQNGTTTDDAEYNITKSLLKSDGSPRWIRTIFVIVQKMWDGGRAKINEIVANMSGLSINSSGFNDIESRRATNVVKYLLDNYTDVNTDELYIDNTSYNWGKIGDLQMAIAPIKEVVNGINKNAGCWIRYDLDGKIQLSRNRWWPGQYIKYTGKEESIRYLPEQPDYSFSASNVRNIISLNNDRTTVTGVTVSALSPNGEPFRIITVPNGASGTGVVEYSDITCSTEFELVALAKNLYYKETDKNRMRLTVKGVGSGFFVGQLYNIENNGTDLGTWLCEKVNTNWSNNGDQKTWETSLDLVKRGA